MKSELFVILGVITVCNGLQFTRCELVNELRKHGFPENKLRNWVCLVEAESKGRTDIVGSLKYDGSRDYGLFQISDKYWCSTTAVPGKECDARCDDFLTNDITKAANCALKIHKMLGFEAWYGWLESCQINLPDISTCLRTTQN